MKISVLTDIGQKRSSNQDYVNKYVNKSGVTLIVLADGMGGHRAGNIASELTVTEFGCAWVDTDYQDPNSIMDWLKMMVDVVNRRVHELGQDEEFKGMGTTVEAAAIIGSHLVYAHVGDSRISLIRDQSYTQLTSDHSLVNALVKAGQITPEEAEVHPQKNIITQSIGQANPVEVDLEEVGLLSGDLILMNSDGLTNMVSSQEITEILQNSEMTLDTKAQTLIDKANQAGGFDNITVALVEVESEDE